EYRLEELLPCEDVEGAPRCRRGEIAAQPLHEACPLALQRRQEREHLHGEDGRGVGSRIEDGLAVSLLEGLFGQLAAQELRDVGRGPVRVAPESGVLPVPAPGERAGGTLPAPAAGPAREGTIGLATLPELREPLRRPRPAVATRVVGLDA